MITNYVKARTVTIQAIGRGKTSVPKAAKRFVLRTSSKALHRPLTEYERYEALRHFYLDAYRWHWDTTN